MKIDNRPAAGTAVSQGVEVGSAVFIIFLCILFGANAVAIKISLAGLGVFTTAGIRFSGAAVVIFLWALLTGKPVRVSFYQFKLMVILGLIFYAQLSLFYLGLSSTTASHGTLIANILPFVVLILVLYLKPSGLLGQSATEEKV